MSEESKCWNILDQHKGKSLEEVQEIAKMDRLPFSVCLMNLEKDLNIGNIFRTSHIMGVEKVYFFGNRQINRRAMVGAQNYLDFEKISLFTKGEIDIDWAKTEYSFLNFLKERNLTPLFIEQTDTSKDIYNGNLDNFLSENQNICVVFGNEGLGINNLLMKNYPNNIFHLNQRGVLRSLNVSSCAAIILNEIKKYYENINIPKITINY